MSGPYSRQSGGDVARLQAENARLKIALASVLAGDGGTGQALHGNGAMFSRTAAPPRTQSRSSLAQRQTVMVAETSEVKRVAGAISGQIRDGSPPTVLATGPGSINQAIKAIAVSRTYLLEDNMDVIAQVVFPEGQHSGKCELHLQKCSPLAEMEESELVVAPQSEYHKVAGAIAGRVRTGEKVCLAAQGKLAVFVAAKSLEAATQYLQSDGFTVKFAPAFVSYTRDSGDTSNKLQISVRASSRRQ